MKHNLCVIGYGGMGGWHAERALTSDVVNLKCIYDIKEEKCQAAEKKGIKAYRSLDEVLNDKDIEIVTIATPNNFHKEIAIKALNAGKNVISEKPVTLSCADLQEMIDAANKNGKLFTVHQNRRWDIDFLVMKQLKDSGELGQIYTIESRIQGSRGIPGDWRGHKEFGGGMLYDWGIHLIDQILQIFSEKIVKVYTTFDHITNKEVDDGFRLELTFESGTIAYVEVGTYNFKIMPRFYMRGERGSAMIEKWDEKCKVTRVKEWGERDVKPVVTAAGLTKTMAPRPENTTENYEIDIPDSDVHDFYRNFCATIEGKETQRVKHAEMMRVMKVIEAAFESVEKNQVINTNL